MRAETRQWVGRGIGLAIGVAIVLAVVFVAVRALDVVVLVFLAILLGAGLEPVVGWLRARGLGRSWAILVVYAAFLVLAVGFAVLVLPAAMVQMSRAVARLPAFLEVLRRTTDTLRPQALADGLGSLIDAAEAALRPAGRPDPNSVVGASVAIVGSAVGFTTLLTLVFFWLTGRSRLQRYALAFVPLARRPGVRDGWNEVEARLGLWVRGQLILMATMGVATGAAYTLIGLPASLLLGLVAAIAEAIPIVGPLLGAIPAIILATTVSPQAVVLTVLAYGVFQFVEGSVLLPSVMRNAVGLSPFLVLVSLLVGFSAGGVLGAIVAVPIAAGIEAVLERLQDREVPVQVDVTGDRATTEEGREEMERTSPDSRAPHGEGSKGSVPAVGRRRRATP